MENNVLSLLESLSYFTLTTDNVGKSIDLATSYKTMRLKAFPAEGMDWLRMHSDLVSWLTQQQSSKQTTPLDAQKVHAFYWDLYQPPPPLDSHWHDLAQALLSHSLVRFHNALKLGNPFTPNEMLSFAGAFFSLELTLCHLGCLPRESSCAFHWQLLLDMLCMDQSLIP